MFSGLMGVAGRGAREICVYIKLPLYISPYPNNTCWRRGKKRIEKRIAPVYGGTFV